ncbi:hypothetical protein GZ998_00855 [Actinomyces sp. 594]|uniref:hypothetical protein n=1 Tax=Actinomyces sp. 594 TaxID=2057793 RepID=UPI001C5A4F57|nr:hypothetical protein [Actinomyces sp. 594]MBW3068066.1 hypothetical protein [Actinomyces sp. 594]
METTLTAVGYLESAWRHGISREDINHALSNPVIVHYLDGYVIVVGPSRSGQLLEIGVNDDDLVFHAMHAREKFLRRK